MRLTNTVVYYALILCTLSQTVFGSETFRSEDRVLIHTLGDSFAKGTQLEGYNSPAMLEQHHALLLKRHTELINQINTTSDIQQRTQLERQKSALEKLLDKFPAALELTRLLYVGGTAAPLQHALTMHLANLLPNDSIFIASGWRGHAIVIEILKQSENGFAVRAYNTGDGISFHHQFAIGSQRHHQPYIELVDVKFENVTDLVFLKGLKAINEYALPGMGPDDFYLRLLPLLNGRLNEESVNHDDLIRPQLSGTCVSTSLFAYYNAYLKDDQQGAAVVFDIQTRIIESYFDELKSQTHLELPILNIAEKSLISYALAAREAFSQGVIYQGELDRANAFVQNATQQLKAASLNISHSKDAPAPEPIGLLDLHFDLDPSKSSVRQISVPWNAIPEFKFPRHNTNISQQIELFVSHLKAANDNQQMDDVKIAVQNFALELPLDLDDWKHVCNLEAIAVSKALLQLTKQHVRACLQTLQSKPKDQRYLLPMSYIAQVKILNVLENLVNRVEPATLALFSTYPEQLKIIWEEKVNDVTPSIAPVYSGLWQKVLHSVMDQLMTKEAFQKVNYQTLSNSNNNIGTFTTLVKAKSIPRFLQLVLKYLTDPINQERLSKLYPDVYQSSSIHQALSIVSDGGLVKERLKILPDEYFLIRDVALYTEYLIQSGENLKPSLKFDFSKDIELVSECSKGSQDDPENLEWTFYYNIFGCKTSDIANYESDWLDWTKTFELAQDRKPKLLKLFETQPFCQHQPLWLLMNEPMISELDLDIDMALALRGLTGCSNLQANMVMEFYFSHPERLESYDDQQLFKRLMFDNHLVKFLGDWSKKNILPAFLVKAADWTKTQYRYYKAKGDFKTAFFFLEVIGYFRNYLEEPFEDLDLVVKDDGYTARDNDSHRIPKSLFLDTRSELRHLISQSNLSNESLAIASLELCRTYLDDPKPLSVHQALEVLRAAITSKSFILDNDYRRGVCDRDYLLAKRSVELQTLFTDTSKRDILLNGIFKYFFPHSSVTWDTTNEFPNFLGESDGESVYFNPIAASLSYKGNVKFLPESVSQQAIIQLLTQHMDRVQVTEIANGLYTFPGQHNSQVHMDVRGPEIAITRVKNGISYYLQDVVHLKPGIVHPYLYEQHYVWIEAISDWKSYLGSSNPKVRLWFHDKNTDRPKYRATVSMDNPKIEFIERLNEDGTPAEEVLSNQIPASYPIERLSLLDDPEHILVWHTQESSKISKIQFSRLDLTIRPSEVNHDTVWMVDEMPGYVLCKNQHIESIAKVPHYLVLEELSTRKQVVIIPHRHLEPMNDNDTSLHPLTRYSKDKPIDRLFIYNIGKTELPQAKTDEGRLYLALMLLWQMEYEKAATLLRGKGLLLSHPSNYKGQTIFPLLKSIIQITTQNNDHDPRGRAVQVLATYILERAYQDFKSPNSDNEKYEIDLNKFLESESWSNTALLTSQEELYLLQNEKLTSLSSNADLLGNRLEQLIDQSARDYYPSNFEVELSAKAKNLTSPQTPVSLKAFDNFLKGQEQADLGFTNIMRPNAVKHFIAIYNAFKGTDVNEMRATFTLLTGEALPSGITYEEAKSYLVRVLKQADSVAYQDSRMNAGLQLLLGVAINPDRFPQSYLLPIFNENSLREKLYEPAMQLYRESIEQPSISEERSIDVASDLTCVERKNAPNVPPSEFEICSIPKTFDDFLITTDIERYITSIPMSTEGFEAYSKSLEGIAGLFKPFNEASSSIAPKVQAVVQNIAEYGEKLAQGSGRYEANKTELLHLKQTLQKITQELTVALEKRNNEISLILKQLPKSSYQQLEVFTGDIQPLKLEELIRLYATQDISLVQRHHPALSVEDISDLYEKTGDYLNTSIRLDHITNVIHLIGQYEGSDDDQLLIEKLYNLLTTQRAYEANNNPAYLAFEYFFEHPLRKDQVEILGKFKIKSGQKHDMNQLGIVVEMIMGSGKTSVLLPLLGQLIADGERLAVLVIPEPLLQSMSEQLQDTMHSSFGTLLEILHVDRYIGNLDESDIKNLLKRLQEARAKKKVLIMTNNSIQSLYLSFLTRMDQYQSQVEAEIYTDVELQSTIRTYQEILTFLRNYGTVMVDEIDFVMDVLKAHYFAVGNKESLHTDTVLATVGLYNLLLEPTISKLAKIPFIRHSQGDPLTDDHYLKVLKPALIDAVLSARYLPNNENYQQFISNLEQKNLVEEYLLDIRTKENIAFVKAIPNIQIRNILSVLQEQLSIVFPLTAKKLLNSHYGPDKNKGEGKNRSWAIPYQLGRPSTQSEFGSELEILNYTLQMYFETGVTPQIVKKELKHLMTLLKRSETSDLAFSGYDQLFEGTNLPRYNLREKEYIALARSASQKHDYILQRLHQHVLCQISSYSRLLHTNAQAYGLLFNQVSGFTGTLWNFDTFPQIFEDSIKSDTQAKTLFSLWHNTDHTVVSDTECQNVIDLVQKVYSGGNQGSLIDLGGLFRGINNEQVADALLNHVTWTTRQVEGVIFYNEEGDIMVKQKHSPEPVPLALCQIALRNLVAYWDQAHTTGSDLKLAADMSAIITFGRHTILRDLLQASWRLRQLGKGQTVTFFTPTSDAIYIKETIEDELGEFNGPLQLGHLIQYAWYHQASREVDFNLRAAKHQIRNAFLHGVHSELIDSNKNLDYLAKLYDTTRQLVEQRTHSEPYLKYGIAQKSVQGSILLQIELDTWANNSGLQQLSSYHHCLTRAHDIVAIMAPKVSLQAKINENYENEVSVQVEQEQEEEQEQETQLTLNLSKSLEMTYLPASISDALINLDQSLANTENPHQHIDLPQRVTPSNRDYTYPSPKGGLLVLKDLLELANYPEEATQIFGRNLLVTSNLHHPTLIGKDRAVHAPFGVSQAFVSHMLIVRNDEGMLKGILLTSSDMWEASLFCINKYPNKWQIIGIFSLHTEQFITLGPTNELPPNLLDSDELRQLVVQAKFYCGDLTYTQEQAQILKNWFSQMNVKKIKDFFYDVILLNRPSKKRHFKHSVIDAVFQQGPLFTGLSD